MPETDAAVAIVHARGPADSVLLIRRAERDADPWSGHWSFPGGRREPVDPDLLDTARRELEEECGILLARDQLEVALPLSSARRRVGRFLLVAPFVFRVDAEHLPRLNPREAVEAVWVPLTMLRDPHRHTISTVPGVPPEIRFPAIDLNGVPLWGFTYRLITDWLDLNPRGTAREDASYRTATRLLTVILAGGCVLEKDWSNQDGIKVATVRGPIPVAPVLASLTARSNQIPPINMLEVRPEIVRVVGLGFEEYVITALF